MKRERLMEHITKLNRVLAGEQHSEDHPFKVGDEVCWWAHGSECLLLHGTIVAVVPQSRSKPETFLPSELILRHFIPLVDKGYPRDHESYVVKVGDSPRLFCPPVNKLNFYSKVTP